MALSPKQVNVTPLQIEILERDIAELRTSLTEAKARNISLENIIDEQKQWVVDLIISLVCFSILFLLPCFCSSKVFPEYYGFVIFFFLAGN